MLTFAPNLSWLFPETPFAERAKLAAKYGFNTVEFGFASHADIDILEKAHRELDLQIVLFNQDVPAWDRVNRGYLVDPGRKAEFKHKLDEALHIAFGSPYPEGLPVPFLGKRSKIAKRDWRRKLGKLVPGEP